VLDCVSSSVNGHFKRWDLAIQRTENYDEMLDETCARSKDILQELLKVQPVKAQVILTVGFSHAHGGEGDVYTEATFRTICEPLLIGSNLPEYLSRVKDQHLLSIEGFERLSSGWTYDTLVGAHLDAARYKPLKGGSYVKVPKKIKDMKSTINIHSSDLRCFLFCLIAKKLLTDDKIAAEQAQAQGLPEPKKRMPPSGWYRSQSSSYIEYEDEINMEGIQYPVKMTDVKKIEELNKLSISIFEWDYREKYVIPLRHGTGDGTPVELLYLEQGEKSHYVLIKDFNAFMRHRTKHNTTRRHCLKCLYGYPTEEKLAEHVLLCTQRVYQTTRMPQPGHTKFESHWKRVRKIFYIYADFETKLMPVQGCEIDPNPPKTKINERGKTIKVKQSHTEVKEIHAPVSYSLVTGSTLEDYEEVTSVYSNANDKLVSETFFADLGRIHANMMDCYENSKYPIDMSEWDEIEFQSSTHCHICKKSLDWKSKKLPVRDHDHFLEHNNFRGASHNHCNLNFWERTKKVVVFFHNMAFDLNNFLLELIKSADDEKYINIVPENLEKFKSISDRNFTFLDTYSFLASSLETLVDNLKDKGAQNFKRLIREFPDHYELLMQKGIYPYEWVKDFDVFSETSLPPREAFYNALTETEVSERDYAHAQRVWSEMNCRTFRDYMEIYVLADSVLLHDVFESFKDLCMDYYDLDPSHYMSLPAIGFDAMLKMTGVQIEKITDQDIYNFVFNNLRGGITTISQRMAKANNPYLLEYDETQPTTYIQYLDINNLYGVGLQGPLPISGFRWLLPTEIEEFDLSQDPDGKSFYLLEVDLEYPSSLHDEHNCYPLAVEKRAVLTEELSPYNLHFLEKNDGKHSTVEKLIPDLNDKSNYVCSLKNLQFFLSHGLILKKIHKVLTAVQEPWMSPFIQFNTARRAEATSKFDKDLFKYFNNSCYGKLIEDVRKRRNVAVVKSESRAKKLTTKPQMMNFHMVDDNTSLIQSVKRVLTLEKPVACGIQVLEASKYQMMFWWYNILKVRYGENIKLILSDTDSLVYHVKTEDAYRDLVEMKNDMDLSGYPDVKLPDGTPLYDKTNKKVVGKMSDEKPGEIISEVVALKPKMYSVKAQSYWYPSTHPYNEDKRAKGVPKVAKKRLSHEDYKAVLLNRSTTTSTFRSIRGVGHVNKTLAFTKKALSAYDDKKFILENGLDCLSYGHYKIADFKN